MSEKSQQPAGWHLYGSARPDAEPFAYIAADELCDCPWWHRLPFVGRFVHSDLP